MKINLDHNKVDTRIKKINITRGDVLTIILLIIIVLLVWGPLKYQMIVLGDNITIDAHTQFAAQMDQTGIIPTSHFLLQALIIGVHKLFPESSFEFAAWLVDIAFQVFAVLIIYSVLLPSMKNTITRMKSIILGLLTITLLLVWPIPLLFPLDQHLQIGYLGISNQLNSPTQILLKPIALLLFLYAVRVFYPSKNHSFKTTAAILFLLTILSIIAKPSYIICLLPAMIITCGYMYCKKQPFNWRLFVIGILLPASIILGWQYLATYTSLRIISRQAGITFLPLGLYSLYPSGLLPKFLLSILYPLIVTGLYFKSAINDLYLRFAWLNFVIGAIYSYSLVETVSMQAGNFVWSGQITSFILFVTTTVFLIRQNHTIVSMPISNKQVSHLDFRFLAGFTALTLHTLSGIIWYYLNWLSIISKNQPPWYHWR